MALSAIWLGPAGIASASENTAQADTQSAEAASIIPASHRTTIVQPATVTTLSASDSFAGLYKVSAEKTPSGFAVPRFVSLKFGRVNARTGPSRNHAIAYQYRRRGLPLIVVAETEMWRKVRDMDGDEAWVRKPALSGERYALFSEDGDVLSKSDPESDVIARVQKGAQVKLEDCSPSDYCRIRTTNGLAGFARKAVLWGSQSAD
jgi:SH3-like domain-containing protein